MLSSDLLAINPDAVKNKISSFISEQVIKAGLTGGVVAVSGGIDSAVTLVLTVNSLGPSNVTAITMPERDVTDYNDVMDVKDLTANLGVTCEEIDITKILHVIRDFLPIFDESQRVAYGNIKARIRMTLSYYYANVLNRMVIGSSNKTELLIGFFTKYGDGGVDLMPLGDLYKTQLRQLARHLEIPKNIIEKTPSPGFWPGHTDEGELGMAYEDIDIILYGWEQGYTQEYISNATKLSSNQVERIIKRIEYNAHKRRLPLILRLSDLK
jgi:NAD+ synthase